MTNTGVAVFDSTVQKTRAWLNEIQQQLGWSESEDFPATQRSYTVLRAVLFALRDGLPASECAQLAGQMPMLVRGIFFEAWHPQRHTRYKSKEEFYERVAENMRGVNVVRPDVATATVCTVLMKHISAGEISDVLAVLPFEVAELFINAVASTGSDGPVEPAAA